MFRLSWALNLQTNSTSFRSLKFSHNFRDIYKANDILNRNIISLLAYITISMCAVILASKLQTASRFRRSLTSQPKKDNTVSQKAGSLGNPLNDSKSTSHNMKEPDKMSAKDVQVIQSVTLICVIFILSQLPFQVVSTVRLFVPEFANLRSAEHSYAFFTHISNTCGYLNASVNIFVHIRFNARYRAQFLALFSKKFT